MNEHVFADEGEKLRFVGDFEALYRTDTDPWFQSGSGPLADYYHESRDRLVEVIRRHAWGDGIEFGCGHGHVTDMLRYRLYCTMTGVDISETAVGMARMLYPQTEFFDDNLIAQTVKGNKGFGFAIWGQLLWYVLHQVDLAVENTLSYVRPGGIFVISQAFLAGKQRYGTEIIEGFNGALSLFHSRYRDRLQLIEARYDDSERFKHRDGLLVFRVDGDAEHRDG